MMIVRSAKGGTGLSPTFNYLKIAGSKLDGGKAFHIPGRWILPPFDFHPSSYRNPSPSLSRFWPAFWIIP
jgi:hypothetical protein